MITVCNLYNPEENMLSHFLYKYGQKYLHNFIAMLNIDFMLFIYFGKGPIILNGKLPSLF
jgi:hypothetical protein